MQHSVSFQHDFDGSNGVWWENEVRTLRHSPTVILSSQQNELAMEQYIRSLYLTDFSNMLLALHSATNWLIFYRWPKVASTVSFFLSDTSPLFIGQEIFPLHYDVLHHHKDVGY